MHTKSVPLGFHYQCMSTQRMACSSQPVMKSSSCWMKRKAAEKKATKSAWLEQLTFGTHTCARAHTRAHAHTVTRTRARAHTHTHHRQHGHRLCIFVGPKKGLNAEVYRRIHVQIKRAIFVLFCFVWLATLGVPVVASGAIEKVTHAKIPAAKMAGWEFKPHSGLSDEADEIAAGAKTVWPEMPWRNCW